MNKVIVYGGIGANEIKNMIENDLPIDVVEILDEAEGSSRRGIEIRKMAETKLMPYLGKSEVIIFTDAIVTIAVRDYFCKKYPKQKFVWFAEDITTVVGRKERVAIFASDEIRRYQEYQEMKASCQETEILEITEVNSSMNGNVLPVMILTATKLLIEDELRRMLGWGIEVIDWKESIMDELYVALGLKGVKRGTFRVEMADQC